MGWCFVFVLKHRHGAIGGRVDFGVIVGKSMQEVGRRASTSMNPNENLQLLPQ
jgi:hypothetical protein